MPPLYSAKIAETIVHIRTNAKRPMMISYVFIVNQKITRSQAKSLRNTESIIWLILFKTLCACAIYFLKSEGANVIIRSLKYVSFVAHKAYLFTACFLNTRYMDTCVLTQFSDIANIKIYQKREKRIMPWMEWKLISLRQKICVIRIIKYLHKHLREQG